MQEHYAKQQSSFSRAGFDVWLPEMRGHGLSARNIHWNKNRVADYARYDLPAIGAFVKELSGQSPHWIGHSQGGISLAAALGGQYLNDDVVASAAFFGTQINRRYGWLKIPPVQWCAYLMLKRFGHLSGARLKRGPEDEPVSIALEALRWNGFLGRFKDAERDWWAGLAEVKVPVLAVAATGDRLTPEWACRKLYDQLGSTQRTFVALGREHGFSSDFSHVAMLVSQPAQKEVWPLVHDWLREH